MTDRPDVTAREADDRPAREPAERRALSMLDAAPDGILLVDELGAIRFVNRQIESLFGYDRDELLGRPVEQLLPDRLKEVHAAHRTRFRVDPVGREMGSGLQLAARRRDGSEFPVEVSLSPTVDADGLATVASVRDITERLLVEAKSRRVQAMLDAAHDGVFVFDASSLQFSYVNQGAVDQTGYSRNELLAMTPLHIKPEFTTQTFRALLEPLIAGHRERQVFETVHRSKAGEDLPVEILLELVTDEDGQASFVAFVRDIADRREAERQLAASESAFRAVFEHAPVGMATGELSESGAMRITQVNSALGALLGRPAESLLGVDLESIVYPEDRSEIQRVGQATWQGRPDRTAQELRLLDGEGRVVWGLVNTSVIRREPSVLVLAHLVDVSERRAAEELRQRQSSWIEGLSEVRTTLLAADRPAALHLVAEHARRLSDSAVGVVCGLDDDGVLVPLARTGGGLAGTVASALTDDPAWADWVGAHTPTTTDTAPPPEVPDLDAFIAEPIVAQGGRSGVLLVGCLEEDGGYDPDHVHLVRTFAEQVSNAFRLAQGRDDRARLSMLEDRERIGRDLHDVVIQRLFAAGMGLQSVRPVVSSPEAGSRIDEVVAELDRSIQELRSAIFGLGSLEPPRSVEDRLRDAVERGRAGLAVDLTLPPHEVLDGLAPEVLEQIVPTVTEAVSNAVRHADAERLRVDVTVAPVALIVQVEDDGLGPPETIERGSGLDNLEERASRLGGTCSLDRNENGGATLRWMVPI